MTGPEASELLRGLSLVVRRRAEVSEHELRELIQVALWGAPSPPDLSTKRSLAGRLGGLRSAELRSARGTAQPQASPKQTRSKPEASASKQPEANQKQPEASASKQTAPWVSPSPAPLPLPDPPDPALTDRSQDLTAERENGARSVGLTGCPGNLQLTPEQRATLRLNLGLEDSQLDTMTADCVGRWVADESKRRTLTQWRQQLAGAITRDANSGKRPPKQTGAGREANRREANFGEANFDDAETREREEGIRAQLEARAQAQRTYEPPPGLLEDL